MITDAEGCVEAAPAKINLHLHVTGRRADGYHLLDSLITFAPFAADRIAARLAPSGMTTLVVTGPFAAALATTATADNLVLRAARALAAPPVALTLDKHLPVASGIGGGSADAAATLRALTRLTGGNPERARAAAPPLGADVPVCLASRTVRISGIGELLGAAPVLPRFGLVLANPGVAVSTPAVFRARVGPFRPAAALPCGWDDAHALASTLAASTANDLEAAATAISPAIGDTLRTVRATANCLLARMSGSGATCFGLYPDETEARNAATAVGRTHPDWWIVAGAA